MGLSIYCTPDELLQVCNIPHVVSIAQTWVDLWTRFLIGFAVLPIGQSINSFAIFLIKAKEMYALYKILVMFCWHKEKHFLGKILGNKSAI
jgi:hypothetical protein